MNSSESKLLDRRQFLKLSTGSTAALVLGFCWPLSGKDSVSGEDGIFVPNAYLEIHANNTVTVIMPRSEMGQKIYTALPQIVAEELEADWSKIKVLQGDLNQVYGSQTTGGSASVRTQYDRLREAGATAKAMLIQAAAITLNVPVSECHAESGYVHHLSKDRKLNYGSLVALANTLPVPKNVTLKDPKAFRIIGKDHKSLDGGGKVDGSIKFGYDFELPEMLTAVVARIPKYGGSIDTFDATEALKVPGVTKIAPISAGVAVLAENSWAALQGRKKLVVKWNDGSHAKINSKKISEDLHVALEQEGTIIRSDGDADKALETASRQIDLTFEVPYLDHAPQEPNNCTAHIHNGICEIWVPTQSPGAAWWAAKSVTQFDDENIKVHTLRMGGAFGRKLQSDYVRDAVEVAQLTKLPVKVIRTRTEDLKNGFYRPSSVHQVKVGLDRNKKPISWIHKLSGPQDGWAPIITGGADELAYDIANQKVSCVMTAQPIPIGAWRSVAHTQNAFVHESMIDEVARKTGRDPLVFRRELLKNRPRHLGVLNLVEKHSKWGKPLKDTRARGLAVHYSFNSYVAIVIEISEAKKGINVERVTAAIDCGTVINPDGVRAQVEGGVVMGLTAALYGEITIDRGEVKQTNFHNYRLLKMDKMPEINIHIVESTEPPTGVGEPPVPPTPPALINAIAALTGKRILRLPLKSQLA
ncbi:MAG: xanthine dehydrogenase family protein molybdopterin-binding subunit [FCB group bacterium]|nr:xanthine dehydrogenase family protein molybdopterin-binding subunit [FCB group bacterium]MBL7026964.1 xanthine dehydrogenase family protein molybdopterin-binding subunit [Candidatus Neomarinimicrobiota bacterium]MBL7122144.1 xanthine dehydrogenase family protein molybdopterin-binding subunit [Candidatus Neomarinimicrobiota bacterium]